MDGVSGNLYPRIVAIRFWFMILQITGILPCSVVYLKNEIRISRSFVLELYQFILTAVFSLLSGYVFYINVYNTVEQINSQSSETYIMSLTESFASALLMTAIMVSVSVYKKRLRELLETTLELSIQLDKKFWTKLFLSNLVTTAHTTAGFIFMELTLEYTTVKPDFVAHFYAVLYAVVPVYISLNVNLLHIWTETMHSNNKLLTRSQQEYRDILNSQEAIKGMCQEMNLIFGPGWLFFFMMSAAGLMYASFNIAVYSLGGEGMNWYFWLHLYFWNSFIVLKAISDLLHEAWNIGTLLFKISTNCDASSTAEIWALQQLHGNIVFSACSIFILDWSFALTIMGAVITYTVIFLQFQWV